MVPESHNPKNRPEGSGGPSTPNPLGSQGPGEPEEDPLVGKVLMGKWRVLERVGVGGFGTVYKVRDEKGGWVEALKILGVDRFSGAEAGTIRKRFLREAQIMKSLGNQSQHIVKLSTYEEDLEAGLVYFLMELVEGTSLADALAQEGPFTQERAVELALQVCDALIVAHEAEEVVVHRDLKLENVMLTRNLSGEELAKVLDFGIAKITTGEVDSRLTSVGTSLGTPGFAAPEQLRAEAVDARTDLFSLGVILYCLLTGRDPWFGFPAWDPSDQVFDLMVATERAQMIPFQEAGIPVPPRLEALVIRLLQRDPGARFQSAREVQEALLRVSRGEDWEGEPAQTKSSPKPKAETRVLPAVEATIPSALRRHLGKGMVAGVLLLVVVGVLIVRPWGRTLSPGDLRARAASGTVVSAHLSGETIMGRLKVGPLSFPFRTPLPEGEGSRIISELREASVPVDTSREVAELIRRAVSAQSETRYFGEPGRDVLGFARQALELDPGSREARSLLLKVAERMAWDADGALEEGMPEVARTLARECLAVVPEHPGCLAVLEATS